MRYGLLAFVLILFPTASAVVINEIMYDPAGSDTNREWVELYNPENISINITGWKFTGQFARNITEALMVENNFLILTTNKDTFLSEYNVLCPVVSVSFGSLNNDGKNILLNNSNNNHVDTVFYNKSWGGSNNNKTLSKLIWNLNSSEQASWRESLQDGGTPCLQNFFEHDIDARLEKTDLKEITLFLENKGLNDEDIFVEFYINETLFGNDELFVPKFGDVSTTFDVQNLTIGNYSTFTYLSFSNIVKITALNFSIDPLPNVDVYFDINISVEDEEYIVAINPENASADAEVFLAPVGLENAFLIGGVFPFDFLNSWWDFFSMVDDSADFGTYNLCANILEIKNYNDTNLENNFACKEFTIVPTQIRARIKTFTNNENYNLNETVFWAAQIFPLQNETGNLTISFQKRNSQFSENIFEVENLNLNENLIFNGNFTISDESIEGIYKIRGKFKYSNKYFDSRDTGQFWLNGLKDLGPTNITVLSLTNNLKFGDFGIIFSKFFVGNYNLNAVRFLAYGSPKQILSDLSGKGITTGDWNASTAVEISDVKRGQEIYVAVPALLKANCDSTYEDGMHRIRLRAYDSEGKVLATTDVNLDIAGKENIFCPQSQAFKTTAATTNAIGITKSEAIKIEIAELPTNVQAGTAFVSKVKLTNLDNSTKSFDVYSYIYKGQKLLTEGGWTGNKQTLSIKGQSSETVSLQNTIKQAATVEKHNFKVRAIIGDEKVDATSTIEISEGNSSTITEKSAEIKSFYTRARNFNVGKQIKLYTTIENNKNLEANYKLNLENVEQEISLTPKSSERFEFNVTLPDSSEVTYNLMLLENSLVTDTKSLAFKITNSENQIEETEEDFGNQITGDVVWSSEKNANVNAAIILFVATLLVLVLALIKSIKTQQ